MVAKSFPRKQVLIKKIVLKIFWPKMFYGCKLISSKTGSYQKYSSIIFWSKMFYSCTLISSKTGSYQTFWSKILMVANLLPRKQAPIKHFHQKFFMVANSFPRKQVPNKSFHQHFLVETFYGCKIISSKIGSHQKLSLTFFGLNFLQIGRAHV